MNFSLADLDAGWSLVLEQGLDELLPTLGQDHNIVDANRRLFVSPGGDMVASVVLNTRSGAAARKEMQADLLNSWRADVQQQLPDATLEELTAPSVGDATVMFRVQAPAQDATLYGLAFRKANVFAMIVARGSEKSTTAQKLTDYALQLQTKIH
jgi:hypothetical protein